MGVKKKLKDMSIKVSIEMGKMKATVDFDPKELFVEETKTIRPREKDGSDLLGFHEILSARCEFMRQILDHFGKLPLDLSTKIKKLIELKDYCLLYYDEKDRQDIILECNIERFILHELDGGTPPTFHFRLVFGSPSRKDCEEIPSTWIKMFSSNSRSFFPSAPVFEFIKKFSTTKEESLAKMKRNKSSIVTVNDMMESSLSSLDSIATDIEEGVMDDDDKEDVDTLNNSLANLREKEFLDRHLNLIAVVAIGDIEENESIADSVEGGMRAARLVDLLANVAMKVATDYDDIKCHVLRSLHVIEPPLVPCRLIFPSFLHNEMATIPTPCYTDDVHEEEFSCQHNEDIETIATDYSSDVELLERLVIPSTLQKNIMDWYHHYLQHPGEMRFKIQGNPQSHYVLARYDYRNTEARDVGR